MGEGLVSTMASAYPAPRASMERQVSAGLNEPRALLYLMAACGVFFVASMPAAIRSARGIDVETPVSAAIGAHIFGYLFLAPLLLYGAALVVHWIARAFGGRGSSRAARTALFWSLLLASPLALGLALLGVAVEVARPALLPWLSVLSYAAFAYWLWIFAACLAEAERFQHSGRVALAVGAGFALFAVLLGVVLEGPAAASGALR